MPSASATVRQYRANRLIVELIILIYVLLILEGAVRKWLFPTLGDALFFVRAPIALLIYWIAFSAGLWPRPNKYLAAGIALAGAAAMLAPLQLLLGNYSAQHALIAAYGWHNYFLYLPLAFIIGEQVKWPDLLRIARVSVWLLIAVTPLVLIQYYSPADSIIVRGTAELEQYQFIGLGFGGERIRPMGLFTSSVGQQVFVASGLAFVLGVMFVHRSERRMALSTLALAALCAVLMIGFGGQRGLVVHAGLVMAFVLFAAILVGKRSAVSNAFLMLIGLGACTLAYATLLVDVYSEFADRFSGANEVENEIFGGGGSMGRIAYELIHFLLVLDDAPVQGYLIGIAGNAATVLEWVVLPESAMLWSGPGGWAEDGLTRNIVELGLVLGPLFIAYRFALLAWIMGRALTAVRATGHVLPLALVGFSVPLLAYLQMTGHGTLVGYTWMFVGFSLAAARAQASPKSKRK